jgi:hypothetical protein
VEPTTEPSTTEPSTTVEPTTDSETDSESGSGTDPHTTSESESETGEPMMCLDPNLSEFFPAGCPEALGGVQLPAQGCYEECTGLEDACEIGRCMLTQVDPCPCANNPEACCDACSGEQWLCVEETALGDCGLVLGRTFTSLEELECGLGPDGVELCNWTVAFDFDGTFIWMHSDVGEGGTYACADGAITVTDGPQIVVDYDVDADILTWDGVQYE